MMRMLFAAVLIALLIGCRNDHAAWPPPPAAPTQPASQAATQPATAPQSRERHPTPLPDLAAIFIEVKLAKDAVVAGETVEATLHIVNTSQQPQSFVTMTCSWIDDWQSNTPKVAFVMWVCDNNRRVTETLAPGESWERTVKLHIAGDAPIGKMSFNMGFTPRGQASGQEKTAWSDDVFVTVKRP